MSAIFALDIYYLTSFFLAIFAASFALPTGAIVVIVSFASVASGWSDISLLILLSLLATISGDYSAYLVARYFRKNINSIIEDVNWIKIKKAKVEKLFDEYGGLSIFLTRFLFSGIGPYVNFFSGLQNMSRWEFLKAVVAGEIIYCFTYLFIGYFFRDTWQGVMITAQDYAVVISLSLVGIIIIYRIVKLLMFNNGNSKANISKE